MATFPLLKTTAVMQYPATKEARFHNQALRFVDGGEQRYRDGGAPLHAWTILLSELDDSEMAAMEGFFAANQGQLTSFAFTDPWSGTVYENCTLTSGELHMEWAGEGRGKTTVTIAENRT